MTNKERQKIVAESYGIEVTPDETQRTWWKFTKGNKRLWECKPYQWCVAEIIDNRFRNHKYFDYFEYGCIGMIS